MFGNRPIPGTPPVNDGKLVVLLKPVGCWPVMQCVTVAVTPGHLVLHTQLDVRLLLVDRVDGSTLRSPAVSLSLAFLASRCLVFV